jgi:CRISPR/Cas system-associated exonuclease Cas4 (RecB family)
MIDFNKLIDKHLIREYKPKQVGRYYPSEIGGCIRKTWFSYKKPKQVKAELLRIFEAGNMLHEFIAKVLSSEKTPEVELLKQEIPIKVEEKNFVISGRIDNLVLVRIKGKKVLVEVKSSKYLYDKPQPQHVMQLQFYMYAIGIHSGMLLYIQKDNLQTKWFNIEYDSSVVERILKRFKLLDDSLKQDKIPEAEAKLNSELSWMCRYCDYKEDCDNASR